MWSGMVIVSTMIVFAVGGHIPKIFGNIGNDFAGVLPQPTIAGYIFNDIPILRF